MCEKLIIECKDYEIAWVIFNQVRQFVQLEGIQKWNPKIQRIHRVFRLNRIIFIFLLYSSPQLIFCVSLSVEIIVNKRNCVFFCRQRVCIL
jgi:hypothetical protein